MSEVLIGSKNNIINFLNDNGWKYEEGDDFILVFESDVPYLFIEFNEDINIESDEQFFTTIHNDFGTSFFAVTDGEKAKISFFAFGCGIYFEDVHSVEEFLNIPAVNLNEYNIYGRINSIEFLSHDAIVDQFIDFGIISEATNPSWQKRFTEFANALFYEEYEPTNRKIPIEILEDLYLEYRTSKNASGGGYEGLHRKFLVKLPDNTEIPFVISLFATAGAINDPVYGNRKGTTQLNIAILDKPNNAYNLQVSLDKFVDTVGNNYEIWHSGIRSRMKKEYVLNIVQEIAPFLMDGDRIKIGRFPLEQSIDVNSFSRFIENIIVYSYCRKQADLKYKK